MHSIMSLILNIFLFLTASVLINVHANECNLLEDKSPSLQLLRHLFCDYETSERPTLDQNNATSVNLQIISTKVELEDYSNTLQIHAWIYVSWRDDYLQWKASDFDEIDSIWVESYRIWTPKFTIQNAVSAGSVQMDIPPTKCRLSDDGKVLCVSSTIFSSRCDADYTYWPFDIQNCSIQLSSWAYNSNEMNLQDNTIDVLPVQDDQHHEWNVISLGTENFTRTSKYEMHDEISSFTAHFLLQRTNVQLWRVYGTPSIILVAMTLTTLWLDPKSNERLLLACVNFFCHFLCMGNLHWILPDSHAIPNILMFYHNSLILVVVALILTCLFRKIIDANDSPPPWISSLVSKILLSKVGQILLLSILDPKASASLDNNADDNSDLVNSQTPGKSTWAYVAIILGWISFISIFLTYIIMFAIFFRTPSIEE